MILVLVLLDESEPFLLTVHDVELPILALGSCRTYSSDIAASLGFCNPKADSQMSIADSRNEFVFKLLRAVIQNGRKAY